MQARSETSAPRALPWWALAAVVPALLLLLPLLFPAGGMVEELVRAAFSPFCHQDAARTLEVGGRLLPVCARCTGFYAGLAIATAGCFGVTAAGHRLSARGAWLLLLLPLVVDGTGNLAGLWMTSAPLRMAVGGLAALPLALVLVDARRAAH